MFIRTVIILGAVFIALQAQVVRPNIFFIMADDLSARDIGVYGSAEYLTPNIDALAEGGVRFSTAWATPICMSSRAEILTGRYGFRTGWRHNHNAGYECAGSFPAARQLAGNHITFANVLRSAGYATAIAGKWMLQDENTNLTRQLDTLGFEEYAIWPIQPCFLPPNHEYPGSLAEKFTRYWDPVLIKNGKYLFELV